MNQGSPERNGAMAFDRNGRDLPKAKAKTPRAAAPADGIRADERLGKSRRRRDASLIPRSEDLAYSHACRPSNNFSTLFAANDRHAWEYARSSDRGINEASL